MAQVAQVGYRYSVPQRVFIYDSYIRTESARAVRILFREKFPDVQVPGRTSIHRLVNKLRKTGSLLDKKRNKPRTVLTQETVGNIGHALQRSPTKSLRRLAQEMDISYGSVRTGTKLLKLKPYKITAVQELKPGEQFPKQEPEMFEQRREAVSTSPGMMYAMEVASASDIKTEPDSEDSGDCPSEEPSRSTSPAQCEPEEVFLVVPKTEPDHPQPEESIKEEYPEYHSISPELCIVKESSEDGDIISKYADLAEPDNIITPGTRQFQCSLCNKGFLRKAHLRRHMPIHNEKKDFKCDICLKEFTEKCSLKGHLLTHSGEKPFQCTVCNRGYSQKKSLKKHVVARHMETEMIHSCTVCGRRFADDESLQDHLRSHIQLKKYTCNICSRDFCDKSGLNKHSVVHSEEKRFVCPYCKKKFGRNDHLKNHLRVHTGERVHECPACAKAFSLKDALAKHLLVHTREKVHTKEKK